MTALSLLVCVAAAAMWAASYRWTASVTSTTFEKYDPATKEFWMRDRLTQAWRGVLVVSDRRWLYGRSDGESLAINIHPGRSWNWERSERYPPHRWQNWRRRPPRYWFALHRYVSPAAARWPRSEFSGAAMGGGLGLSRSAGGVALFTHAPSSPVPVRPLPLLRLRPPRHAGQVSGVRMGERASMTSSFHWPTRLVFTVARGQERSVVLLRPRL